ncbi:MAG: hypothetical protein ACLVJR_04805 [Negativibacillus sp.]
MIRSCDDYGMPKGYYRIAVRSHADNQKLVEAMERFCYAHPAGRSADGHLDCRSRMSQRRITVCKNRRTAGCIR